MRIRRTLKSSLRKHKKLALGIFMVAMLLSAGMIYLQAMHRMNGRYTATEFIADAYVNRLQSLDRGDEQNLQFIEMLIVRQQGGTDHFARFAAELMSQTSASFGVQLAPDGILAEAYPGDVSLLPKGQDIFKDEHWKKAAAWSKKSGHLTYLNTEEHRYLIMSPVYLPEGSGQRFWGFVFLGLQWQDLSPETGLGSLLDGHVAYTLTKKTSWLPDAEPLVLMKSPQAPQGQLIERKIPCADGEMFLQMSPLYSWSDVYMLLLDGLLGLLFSLLLAGSGVIFFELHREKHEYEALSFVDPLTGLYNRRKFLVMLQKACRHSRPFLLCYIDFDKFKAINDVYGHDVGDELLRAGARRLQGCMPASDALFRIGGDEFVAYIEDPGTETSRTERVAKLHKEMEQPFLLASLSVEMKISVGYVLYPRDAKDFDELLHMADKRMYEEKKRHKL